MTPGRAFRIRSRASSVQAGIPILRGERVSIARSGEASTSSGSITCRAADGAPQRGLGAPVPGRTASAWSIRHRVNILLSHNPEHLRPRGRAGHRSQPRGPHPRRPGGAGVHQPRDRAQPPGHSLCRGLVRKARRPALREPRHRHHRRADPHRRAARDHAIRAEEGLNSGLAPYRTLARRLHSARPGYLVCFTGRWYFW